MSEKKVTYIINNKVILKPITEESRKCNHDITLKKVEKTYYRFCIKCGIRAHEDNFNYGCGSEYCKCLN